MAGLETYFSKDGPLAGISLLELQTLASQVYDRCMCLTAYGDALGYVPRDKKLYGPNVQAFGKHYCTLIALNIKHLYKDC